MPPPPGDPATAPSKHVKCRSRPGKALGSHTSRTRARKRNKTEDSPPPPEFPQYPPRPMSYEEMLEIEHRQRKYIAHYGAPWLTESFCGDESAEEEGEEAASDNQADIEGYEDAHDPRQCPRCLEDAHSLNYCPECLEDSEIKRIVLALGTGLRQIQDSSKDLYPLNTPTLASPSHSDSTSHVHTSSLAPPSSPSQLRPDEQDMRRRLRPKDSLRLTERAQKFYRS
ncbi:hypothetical protein NMY22_g7402 [Coprinellus aureogranulatus]|nr:hypothetical protein NMY22_g7402 [Coprinellus aureogranulatus]